jgi:hypothetical protein
MHYGPPIIATVFGFQLVGGFYGAKFDCSQNHALHPTHCQHAEPSSQVPLPEGTRTTIAASTSVNSDPLFKTYKT